MVSMSHAFLFDILPYILSIAYRLSLLLLYVNELATILKTMIIPRALRLRWIVKGASSLINEAFVAARDVKDLYVVVDVFD